MSNECSHDASQLRLPTSIFDIACNLLERNLEDCSGPVYATELSCAVEIARSITIQSAARTYAVCAGETMHDPKCAVNIRFKNRSASRIPGVSDAVEISIFSQTQTCGWIWPFIAREAVQHRIVACWIDLEDSALAEIAPSKRRAIERT